MTDDRDPTIESYQILADLLVTIRRVVHRGLEKVSGTTWYLDGCPPGLFEQLVERKEKEIAIDRFGGEYQELITFASLDDLAAIIEYNTDLAKLLASLEPEGEPMIDRLRSIEAFRLKMAAAVPFDDDDLQAVIRYHTEFRESLTRRKRARGKVTSPPPPSDEPVVAEEEKGDPPPEDIAALETPEEETVGGGVETAEIPLEFSTQVTTFEELTEIVGGPKAVAPRDGSVGDGGTLTDVESSNDLAGSPPDGDDEASLINEVALAITEDDDRKVLRLLHREVTGIAEGAIRKMLDFGHPVWDTVRSSGWYDMKKADLALAPLEVFYTVIARATDVQRSGAGFEAVKATLGEAGFSKLLLSLREMFMRQKL